MNTRTLFALFVISFSCFYTNAQEYTVKGKVTTFDEYALNKVSIFSKQTETVAYTDTSGLYSIRCAKNDILVFKANGFYDKKIKLKKEDVINDVDVNLKFRNVKDNVELATGYGHIDKDKLTHAIEHLDSNEDFSSYNSVLEIIKGRISGVSVGTSSITIRGASTYQGNEALIVVDKNVVDFNYLKNLPTSEVKSVDVLKGDSASARYGSRGMDGVIVIQTKSEN